MEWSDVQLFVCVARIGTVRGAGRALRVDASTVSRRLAALEQALGVRLFQRTAGGLILTSSGRLMMSSGERVDGELEELRRRILGRDRRLTGVVRITLPGAFTALVHGAARTFAERYEAIELELSTQDTLLDVDGRKVDVALRVGDRPPEHLIGQRVALLASALYATREYLGRHEGPVEAPAHTWVEWDQRFATKPPFVWLNQRFPNRRVTARGLSTTDVLHATLAGLGIGPLPCVLGDVQTSLVRLADIPESTASSVWVLSHANLRLAARVRAAMSHVVDVLRENRSLIEGSGGRVEPNARRREPGDDPAAQGGRGGLD